VVSGVWIHPEKLRYLPQERKAFTEKTEELWNKYLATTPDFPREAKILFHEVASQKS
jgi:hypothetical protein